MAATHPAYTVAIVTGGCSCAGRELASELARRGYAVVVVYLRDQAAAEGVVDSIRAAGGTALTVRADVTDELDVERLFDETAAALGGVDVVVHAARRGAPIVLGQAARRIREGGAIVSARDVTDLVAVLRRRDGPSLIVGSRRSRASRP
jgi:3-oxoacyl-[acyl-carrier protein] reductase